MGNKRKSKTPKKEDKSLLNSSLTPVKLERSFEESPRNAEVLTRRLDALVKKLIINHEKWMKTELEASSLCRVIESIKTRNFNETLYPPGLQEPCDKLAETLKTFEQIASSAKTTLEQLNALAKLNENKNAIFYKTWTMQDFLDFVQNSVECYEKEVEIKRIVTRNIAHCTDHPQLIIYSGACSYPVYVNEDFNVTFKCFEKEIESKW